MSNVKHLRLRKINVLNFRFSQKENLNKSSSLKSKKVQGIFGETFILALAFSAVFRLQKRVSDFFYCFV